MQHCNTCALIKKALENIKTHGHFHINDETASVVLRCSAIFDVIDVSNFGICRKPGGRSAKAFSEESPL